ncbi:hypothetical protein KJ596_02545 [Patescibacteria group bacterium]|nr:hypothetical protein [Patescibacteria group bacterium]MBU1868670.1 hypothetical protein [Patescibacteria group bacterium]
MTKKKKDFRQENIYLKQRIEKLKSQLNNLSPKKSESQEPARDAESGQRLSKETKSGWENYDPSFLSNDFKRSLLLTIIVISALLLLRRWGDPLFQYLPT